MKLDSDRLVFDQIKREDVPLIHELHCQKGIAEFNTLGIPMKLSETEKLLENIFSSDNNKEFGWIVRLKDSNQFIGELGMGISPEMDRGEIHYSIHPDYWGNGYATEAVKRVIEFGFDDLHLNRIEANTASENTRSTKVLEKVGMVKESIQPKTLLIDDDWKDNYTYAILAASSS